MKSKWLFLPDIVRIQHVQKPWLYKRCFACDGDVNFWRKIVASLALGKNRTCSHPRTDNATPEKKFAETKLRKIQRAEFFVTKYRFVASPVRAWLHMKFSPRACVAAVSKTRIACTSKILLVYNALNVL